MMRTGWERIRKLETHTTCQQTQRGEESSRIDALRTLFVSLSHVLLFFFLPAATCTHVNAKKKRRILILADLWRTAGGDTFYRRILQNGVIAREEGVVLRHLRALFRILLRVRRIDISQSTIDPTRIVDRAFRPRLGGLLLHRRGGGGGGASAIFAKLLANWTSSVYYVIAEVYSSVSVGILFWQYANDVVSVDQARRFYPLFAQMSGVAPIVAGQYVVRYASRSKDFGESLKRVTRLITFSGVMICLFYGWSNAYIERTEAKAEAGVAANGVAGGGGSDASPAAQSKRGKEKKKKKAKMTMVESARFLASSEYLRLIATLVLGYGEGKKSFFFRLPHR